MKLIFGYLVFLVLAAGVEAQEAASLEVTWRDNSSNEFGFSIERSLDGVTFEEVHRTEENVEAWTDAGIEFGVVYWYRARAFNAAGYSGYTNVDDGMVEDMRPSAPDLMLVVFKAPNGKVYQVEFGTDGAPYLVEMEASGISSANSGE